MAKSLMICANAKKALRLNESENLPGQEYVLEGIFAELDTLNRNQRVYTKDEYLKHLQYLRNDIKKGEPLLGELDHPEDRFEVKLKEASHQIIDLWYDAAKNVVMGKIKLLNTPNGKLAQSIVDQGIPLHISSRAAGTVNNDNTVSIQQIYTYDLVCKPGFAGAVLHRVNESAEAPMYSAPVKGFLSNSLKVESMNSAPQYGIINENVSVAEVTAPAVLRKEAKEIQINNQIELNEDMSKPLMENTNPDATVGKPLSISGNGGAAALGIPTAGDLGATSEDADASTGEEKKDKPTTDVSDNGSADEKKSEDKKEDEGKEEACPKCGKTPCECEGKHEDDKKEDLKEGEEDDKSDDDKSDDDKKEDSDSEGDSDDKKSEDSGVEIIEVEAEFEGDDKKDDDDMIKDVEAEYDGDKKEDDADDDKSDDDSDKDDEKDDDTSEAKDEDKPCDDDDKKAKEAEKLNDEAKEDIAKHKDDVFKKLDDLKAAIEKKSSDKKESKCESIIMAQYPVSMAMNESNFAEFVSLSESQKNKVVAYLQDNNVTSVQAINENWKNGIDYVAATPVWLKYAPANYKALYEAATPQVKESLARTANYIIFESQYDVNTFWENSGLEDANQRRLLNESFVNTMPKVAAAPETTSLPYGADFIQQIADMASEYNRRY